jgi:hypothetical protein
MTRWLQSEGGPHSEQCFVGMMLMALVSLIPYEQVKHGASELRVSHVYRNDA